MKAELIIRKFGAKGEKTGWTYVEIDAEHTQMINPGVKTSYQVKGKLDELEISGLSLIPAGEGNFILPLNADLRKKLRKKEGDRILAELEKDKEGYQLNPDFLEYLETEPRAMNFFRGLPGSHQKYFSKWIDSAKTIGTRADRIEEAVRALSLHRGYAEMIRARKADKG